MLVSRLIGVITLMFLYKYVLSANETNEGKLARLDKTSLTKTIQSGIFGAGLMFSFADEGLGKWNTENGKNPLIKSLTKVAGRLAGLFGAVGSFLAIIMAFIVPDTVESPELKFMRDEFGKMSEKMDKITRSLDDTKDLIKIENQKSAYIQYEHNIHHGYDRLLACLEKLNETPCANQTECKRNRLAIAEGFISDMNVRKDVEAVYRGVTSDTVFGTSLLELLKEESKCSVQGLNLLTNKVLALISKGMIVSIFHDMLKQSNYKIMDDSKRADKMFTIIENKRQALQDSCISNFDYWMTLDIEELHTYFTEDIQITNANLQYKLRKKYPWVDWHVLTYSGNKAPVAGPNTSPRSSLISSSKLNIHSYVIPTNNAKVEYSDKKLNRWKTFVSQTKFSRSGFVDAVERRIKNDIVLKGQIESYAFLPSKPCVIGYMDGELKQHVLRITGSNASHLNVFVNRPRSESYFVAVSFRPTDYPPECLKSCNGKGKCFLYPYSTTMACRCNPGFSGENCSSSEASIQLQSNINALLVNTMKLPSFTSLQHTLENVQMSLLASSDNIQESITELGNKIDEKFKSLGDFMMSTFGLFSVLLRYNDVVEDLNYFHAISSSKIYNFPGVKNFSIASLTKNASTDRFSVLEEKDIVDFLLTPTGIQKWLYQFNFIVVGKRESEFNSHSSLLFMLMERYKTRLCYPDYKDRLIRTYRQLMLLQLRGYMLWSKAYSFANRDSNVIVNRYRHVLESQQKYLQGETCSIQIPFSENLNNCSDGYLVHKSMDVSVQCRDGFFQQFVKKTTKPPSQKGMC